MAELMTAVVVVGILASVAVVSVGNAMEAARLRQAGDKLVADLRAARQSAIEEQSIYSVVILPNRTSYLIRSGNVGVGQLPADPTSVDFELVSGEVGLGSEPYRLESIGLEADRTLPIPKFKFDINGNCTANIKISLRLGKRVSAILISEGGEITRVDG